MDPTVLATLRQEFADLTDLAQLTRTLLRLGLALLLGAALGWERERHGKAAGLRTHMLVSLGAALFVLVPQQAGADAQALTRVAQGVVAGIGFLGVGMIVKSPPEGRVRGLTTAAGIWTAAAIGVACGYGRETTALLGTGLALVVLALLPHGDGRAARRRAQRPVRSVPVSSPRDGDSKT